MRNDNALLMLGLYKLGYSKLNESVIRQFRKSVKRMEPGILLKRFTYGDVDTTTEVYLLNCKTELDVINYIRREGLSSHYADAPSIGCTGRLFGGEPQITKVCENRFKIRYVFCYDV